MSIQTIGQGTNANVSDVRTYVDTKASALLSTKSSKGINGFLFDVDGAKNLDLSADITDHYTENNSFINDHVVIKPDKVRLSGYIGKLVYRKTSGLLGAIEALNNKLEAVDGYLGENTPGGVQEVQKVLNKAQSRVSAINQKLDQAQNIIGVLSGEEPGNPMQKAYNELESLFKTKTVCTIETPWRFYVNMIIESLSFTENEETEDITDISVSLKEFRVTETKTTSYDKNLFPPRVEVQKDETADNGTAQGKDTGELASSLYTGGVKVGVIK